MPSENLKQLLVLSVLAMSKANIFVLLYYLFETIKGRLYNLFSEIIKGQPCENGWTAKESKSYVFCLVVFLINNFPFHGRLSAHIFF